MQHLEVSGAVRPLYGSLGVKGLCSGEEYRLLRDAVKYWGPVMPPGTLLA